MAQDGEEAADVAALGEAVGDISLAPATSEPPSKDHIDESFHGPETDTSGQPTIRLFIGDIHRRTTEVRPLSRAAPMRLDWL